MLLSLQGKSAYWGVDSISRASTRMEGGVLFDFVTKKAGAAPSFWGRYLNYDGSNDLTKQEADFIFTHSKSDCRILVIYLVHPPSNLRGTEQKGVHDAQTAITLAGKAGVPGGVAIFADIEESYPTSTDWFMGWWKTMAASAYAGRGGVYANPLKIWEKNFNNPYCQAVAQWNREQNAAIPCYIYSQQPQKGKFYPAAIQFAWQPAEPDCCPNTVVAWQYQIHCIDSPHMKGWADMDLATDVGYDLMWSGPDAIPVTRLAGTSKDPTPVTN